MFIIIIIVQLIIFIIIIIKTWYDQLSTTAIAVESMDPLFVVYLFKNQCSWPNQYIFPCKFLLPLEWIHANCFLYANVAHNIVMTSFCTHRHPPIHAGMYCTFQKQMVAQFWTKNNLYEAKGVLLKYLPFCWFLWSLQLPQLDENLASVVWQVSVSEEKSNGWDVLFAIKTCTFIWKKHRWSNSGIHCKISKPAWFQLPFN